VSKLALKLLAGLMFASPLGLFNEVRGAMVVSALISTGVAGAYVEHVRVMALATMKVLLP